MEPGTFAQDFFCRLCAAEGIVIHPLFPPGDNDPKDELVRMIAVLTSVHLAQTDDAGAVICDKCLQMLDLFCKFREECLRQDVLIRTRRTLLAEQLDAQRQQQQTLFAQQDSSVQQLEPAVEVKLEEDDRAAHDALPVIADEPADADSFKQEDEAPEKIEQILVTLDPVPLAIESPPLLQLHSVSHDCVLSSSLNDSIYPLSGTALISSTESLTTSVRVATSETNKSSPMLARRSQGKKQVNSKKTPTGSEPPPYYDYDQQIHQQQHAWDKVNRCKLACDPCQMRFTKSYNLKRHMYEVHGEVPQGLTVIPCEHCGERFLRGNILERHIAKVHQNKNKLKVCAI